MSRFNLTLAAALALAATGVWAQAGPQSIEVRGASQPAARTDVRALCTDIDVDLPSTLANVAREVSQGALVEVQFALEGNRISDVQTRGGPAAYRRAVSWAVRGLECASPDAGRQTVKLRVQFVDPFAAPGQRALALIEGDAAH
jgi:hypothetical protein